VLKDVILRDCRVVQVSFEAITSVLLLRPKLKSILGVGPKVKDSIEDPFRLETWLGSVRVGLHVREQCTTTASGICECYYLVSSFVF
jgi:hypothetical protein